MKSKNVIAFLVAGSFLTYGTVVFAVDQEQIQAETQAQDQVRDRERVYGSQLMTAQERTEYSAKMRNMKTQQERETYRLEHHKKMQERARERGENLPDDPPEIGQGKGSGKGMGSGGGRKGR